jgi:hypothetical protein
MRSTSIAVLGRARSRATRRRTYSARDTPSSLALCRARRCTSLSSVICVRDIMMAPSYQHGLPFPKMDPQSAHLKLPDVSSQDGRDHDPPIHTSGLKADRSVWGLPGADKRAKPRTGRNRKGTGPTLSNNLTNSRDAIFSPKDLFGRCNGRQSHPARTEGECVRVPERNCGERARASGGKGTLSSSVCTSNDGQSRAAHRPEADASTPPRLGYRQVA